jgi:hypothetical protein
MNIDDPNFTDRIIEQVDQEEAELAMLRNFHNEVRAALASENAGSIEHLLAASAIGKHTTIIGRKRYEQLLKAEEASRHALDRAEVVRVLREYIDKSYGIRMEWGVEAREHVEELAHRLGLAGELGTREG